MENNQTIAKTFDDLISEFFEKSLKEKRESDKNVREAFNDLITELIEKSLKDKRENDKEYKREYDEMNAEIREFSEIYLAVDEQEKFEKVKNLMNCNARAEAEHLYIQGMKDAVVLLKRIKVIR